MPDQIAVPDWVIELYSATLGWVLDIIPDIDLGGFIIPDWVVLIGIAMMIGSWGNARERRRERKELAEMIAAESHKPLPPK